MPRGLDESVKCPFFLRYSKGERNNSISVSCEPLNDHMGFDMTVKSCFATREERRNYMELFCCDLFEECPMYKAIYNSKYKEREKNEKIKDKKKT